MERINIKQIYIWPFSMQLLVFCLLSVIIFYLGYQWSFAPLSLELNNVKQEENSLKSDIKTIIRHETVLNHYIARLPMLEQQLQHLKKTMLTRSDSPALLKEILTKGNSHHLYFSLFDPEDAKAERGYDKITIKIVAVGSYHQLADFLSEVANMPRIVVINQFTISKENISDQPPATKAAEHARAENNLTAELVLEVYQIPEVIA